MSRKPTIKTLDPALREELDRLLRDGRHTIAEITEHLRGLGAPVSKSAVGRYHQKFDQIGKRMRESRELAAVWAEKIGKEPQGDIGRVVMEMLHTLAFDVTLDLTETDPKTGIPKALVSPGAIGALALAMQRLESSKKTSFERELKARKVALEEAAAQVVKMEKSAKKTGLDAETLRRVREEIYGLGS